VEVLPAFLVIRHRRCLVVGGGSVAARKVELLLRAEGWVTVVAPTLCAPLAELHAEGRISYRVAHFHPDDLEGCVLAIAATNDNTVNRQVSELCQARGLPVNVVDQPALCSFIMPAIVDRSPVLIAVSTGGASPVLARLLRGRLESLIPATYGRLAALAARFRERVQQRLPADQRRAFWEKVLQGPVAELVFSGRETAAETALAAALEQGAATVPTVGEVYLVGAGPGDPDLLTFRALRLMQQADVVLYDRLVSREILDLCRRDAERIYVGKARNQHALPQTETNALLAQLAREGRRVLRLKGGDPFIFGRGGEEIQTLADEGIPFQVVPGITAAAGCAAYAGIPLTHRDYAQSCVFVTGNLKDGSVNLNWQHLVQPQQTVVIYMGLHGLDLICDQLIAHGLPATFPAALIEQGTTVRQRVHVGDLATLPALVKQAGARAPTLLIVGEVVKLHWHLAWFEPTRRDGGAVPDCVG
jgi:uroporphyrin-III C-methyltransferase/precorrin-2 dehydrogenase/sirohydrochlorin ferrochelatase